MKNIYYPLLLLLGSVFVLGCSDDSEGIDNPGNPNLPDITYSEVSVVPTIPIVDESDYTIYYVDGLAGDDANDGLSESTPFKSLSKVTYMAKTPKMKVLLKSGSEINGNLVLKELKSTPDKPFIFDIYGGAERPTINGSGDQVILIQDENVRVRNLRITNKTGTRGIRIQALTAGAKKNIEITGCCIEDVNWAGSTPFIGVNPANLDVRTICSDARFDKTFGGIVVESFTEKSVGASWYENLYITNNRIHQVSRTAIMIANRWGQRDKPGNGNNEYIDDEHNWYPNLNVVIQGNDMSYIGGDGVILGGSTLSWIDHNTCFYANFLGRTGHASGGLWPYSCTEVVMQYNEAAYTQLANGSADGEGFDIDVACENTIMQYNYAHHNVGGGLLLCNTKNDNHKGSIIRNNIFAHNTTTWKGNMMTISSCVGKTEIYNNLVVISNKYPTVIYSDDSFSAGRAKDITFRNNIFVSEDYTTAKFVTKNIDDVLFEHNIYSHVSNFSVAHTDVVSLDPLITTPADMNGFENALKFAPSEPKVFKSGILFDGMPEEDIAGNDAKGINYVGPFAK
ncbi:right-handed parallel beta-helix repeat-containing protein [Bacteroides sp. 51]|uniref:right-handed parallel beta-helix repeat-containing protein n=1 Tax=Bacteroides sp. 51 TaxID=2302938 RepID=UPI0013D7186A|nr:right-handed parallel beta-helix repeat-containing protein [Bacteroides sp. 51]NDV81902.1 right-handed parallel beta-helix repeat-containing protein [Bacteroides sp. 51]